MYQSFVKHLQIIIHHRLRVRPVQIVKIRFHHQIHVSGIRQSTSSHRTFLHLDHDHPIRRTRTPNRGGRSIFQYGDTLHQIHILRQLVHLEPIHNIQWLRANLLRNRATAPNTHIIIVNRQTGDLTFQQPIQPGTSPQLYFPRRNRRKRSGRVHLLQSLVTRTNHLFHFLYIRFQKNNQFRLFPNFHLPGLHPDKRKRQHDRVLFRQLQPEFSRGIRCRTDRRTFQHNGYPR